MDEGKNKAKKIWELLGEIIYGLKQNERAHLDIEVLEAWMHDENVYVTFHAEGREGGNLHSDLCTSDFLDIARKSIEVINRRAKQRNIEALGCAREIQEILTEAEDDKGKNE